MIGNARGLFSLYLESFLLSLQLSYIKVVNLTVSKQNMKIMHINMLLLLLSD
jgi:hypothetical protein